MKLDFIPSLFYRSTEYVSLRTCVSHRYHCVSVKILLNDIMAKWSTQFFYGDVVSKIDFFPPTQKDSFALCGCECVFIDFFTSISVVFCLLKKRVFKIALVYFAFGIFHRRSLINPNNEISLISYSMCSITISFVYMYKYMFIFNPPRRFIPSLHLH